MKKLSIPLALLILISCGDDKSEDPAPPLKLNKAELSTNYDKGYQFEITQGETDIDENTFQWVSSDETVGEIDNEGYFEGKKIGTTTITATGEGSSLTCEVTIEPYSNLYQEPVLEFGASMSGIKSKETRTIEDETNDILLYNSNTSDIRGLIYLFEDDKMTGVMVLLKDSEAIIEEAVTFLSERYTYQTYDDGIFVFAEGNMGIGISYHNDFGYNITYVTDSESSSSRRSIFKVLKQLNMKDDIYDI